MKIVYRKSKWELLADIDREIRKIKQNDKKFAFRGALCGFVFLISSILPYPLPVILVPLSCITFVVCLFLHSFVSTDDLEAKKALFELFIKKHETDDVLMLRYDGDNKLFFQYKDQGRVLSRYIYAEEELRVDIPEDTLFVGENFVYARKY